ncbi:MAG: 3-oxoacyl-ACP reductase family protein [bacterium]
MRLDGKKALVTGAGQGIGRAIALELARQGADIAICDINPETAKACVQDVADLGRESMLCAVDVADHAAVAAAVTRVLERFATIDILVNNAGWDRIMPFLETQPDFWDRVIDINYKGALNFCHAVCPHMADRKKGKVVNVASDAGRVGSLGETVYAGAKGAVIAFTKSLAREMARYGVHVNCVCPGPTDTELLRMQPQSMQQALERAIPFRRVAQPEEIGRVVAFFASPMSDYVTGQVLSVSGGLTMAG